MLLKNALSFFCQSVLQTSGRQCALYIFLLTNTFPASVECRSAADVVIFVQLSWDCASSVSRVYSSCILAVSVAACMHTVMYWSLGGKMHCNYLRVFMVEIRVVSKSSDKSILNLESYTDRNFVVKYSRQVLHFDHEVMYYF